MKVFVRILLILVILLVVAGIGFVGYGIYKKATLRIQNPIATMEVEGYGTIKWSYIQIWLQTQLQIL